MYDDMTLGEALEVLREPWACGCVGIPQGYSRCYCQLTFDQARRLHRAAHIAIKMVAEVENRQTSTV